MKYLYDLIEDKKLKEEIKNSIKEDIIECLDLEELEEVTSYEVFDLLHDALSNFEIKSEHLLSVLREESVHDKLENKFSNAIIDIKFLKKIESYLNIVFFKIIRNYSKFLKNKEREL